MRVVARVRIEDLLVSESLTAVEAMGCIERAGSPKRLVTELLMQATWFMVGRMGYDYCVFQHALHVL